LFAQAAPVKMGLWEKTMTMDMGNGTARKIAAKSCITPETWQEMVGNMSRQREGCTVDNVKNARGYNFTATCKTSDGGTMVTSGSETIQDSEHIVSQSHTIIPTDPPSNGEPSYPADAADAMVSQSCLLLEAQLTRDPLKGHLGGAADKGLLLFLVWSHADQK
jgi:hypothetical protein